MDFRFLRILKNTQADIFRCFEVAWQNIAQNTPRADKLLFGELLDHQYVISGKQAFSFHGKSKFPDLKIAVFFRVQSEDDPDTHGSAAQRHGDTHARFPKTFGKKSRTAVRKRGIGRTQQGDTAKHRAKGRRKMNMFYLWENFSHSSSEILKECSKAGNSPCSTSLI